MPRQSGWWILRAIFVMFFLCGGSHARADDAQLAPLVIAARKEGQVNWYTTLVVSQVVRPIALAFEKKYGIKVNFSPAPWQETTLKILNEGRAGSVVADVWDAGPAFFPLNAAGMVAPYKPEAARDYPRELKDPAGLWTANIIQVITPAINTDLISRADAPVRLDDLLDPKWKNQMAWSASPSIAGPVGFVGFILKVKGAQEGMSFLKALSKQHVANVSSNQRVVLDQVIQGQYPMALSIYDYHAAISAAQGAPVAWASLDQSIETFGTAGLVRSGPHPNAGKLLLEFMLSPQGQKIIADAGYLPASPAVAPKFAGLMPDTGHFKAVLITPGEYNQHEAEWTAIVDELFDW
ncbi:extracellular solute-binding protein [Caballeronia sp. LZ035]|uniref:ABC transporter substrate-binding protein n=1 Tax=Caballeronia sp. LZ035 TaxID=3038568 RepID=UPI00285AED18|nr:extracellular solute-binding protein [Caballeronia sp. LZ035]MDR5759081.1 extracellular solute-binding protein [Caballeronia sp. LZ035]